MTPRTMTPEKAAQAVASPSTKMTATYHGRILGCLAIGLLVASAGPVAAQGYCTEPNKNMQCTEFGTITMDSQRDIRGEPIDVVATITLNTVYSDNAARWLLFSVRNVTDDGSNPVTITLTKFSTSAGDIPTTRIEHPSANELNLWVDTLDAPVGATITVGMQVGSTERGAYRLETLVMAFDRGYSPIVDSSGHDASLFSFTLLGVNKETVGVASDGGSLMDGRKLPGLELVFIIAIIAAAAGVLSRRRAQ